MSFISHPSEHVIDDCTVDRRCKVARVVQGGTIQGEWVRAIDWGTCDRGKESKEGVQII